MNIQAIQQAEDQGEIIRPLHCETCEKHKLLAGKTKQT